MNRNKKSVALLPFPVIAAAAGGDTEAVGRRIEGDINGKLFFQPFSH